MDSEGCFSLTFFNTLPLLLMNPLALSLKLLMMSLLEDDFRFEEVKILFLELQVGARSPLFLETDI